MEETVSRQQFAAVAFCALLSPAIRTIPALVVHLTGEHAYISVLLSILPLLALAALLCHFQRYLGQGEGMAELFLRALGKFWGRGLLLAFGLWMLFYCAFVMRISAHRFISTIFSASSPPAFIPAMGLLTLMVGMGAFRSLCRLAAIMRPVLSFTLLAVLLLCLPQVEPYTYSRPLREDLPHIALGVLPVLNALSIWGYLAFLEGHVDGERPRVRHFAPMLLRTVLLLALLCYTTVGSFGPHLADKLSNPFFVMIRNIRVFTALERVEALVIALWFFTDFILAGAMLHAGLAALSRALNLELKGRLGRGFILLSVGAITALALMLAPGTTALTDLSMLIIPAVNMLFMFALLPGALIIGSLRKRI